MLTLRFAAQYWLKILLLLIYIILLFMLVVVHKKVGFGLIHLTHSLELLLLLNSESVLIVHLVFARGGKDFFLADLPDRRVVVDQSFFLKAIVLLLYLRKRFLLFIVIAINLFVRR